MIVTHLPVKIAVCDDKESVRRTLVTLISKYIDKKDLVVDISEFSSGEDFMAADPDSFHLVFLDVCMESVNGLGIEKTLCTERNIFGSVSKTLCVKSKYVKKMRYLVKPPEEARLFRVLDEFFYVDLFMPH